MPGVDEALRLIESERFDLYVLDGELPGVSGLTLCQQIRAVDAHTPIIIISGLTESGLGPFDHRLRLRVPIVQPRAR
ncbi:MAG: response regulator [Pyrinomonadaceae bacterium]